MRERRIALWVRAGAALAVGVWAQFAPASFYTSFPAGRGWVSANGPYNEHLIRDLGGLYLGMAVMTLAAARTMRTDLVRLVAGATLLFAVPHLAFHATHLQPFGTADAVGNVVALGAQVLLALWLAISPAPAGVDPTGSSNPEATARGAAHGD